MRVKTISVIQQDDETLPDAIARLDQEVNDFMAADDDQGYMHNNGASYKLNGGIVIGSSVEGNQVFAYTFVR